MVQSVLAAKSTLNEHEVQEWELNAVVCPHAKNLDQSTAVKIADKSLAHCGECNLNSNLWLCMTCGHLGCGRPEGGGNGHAVAHS